MDKTGGNFEFGNSMQALPRFHSRVSEKKKSKTINTRNHLQWGIVRLFLMQPPNGRISIPLKASKSKVSNSRIQTESVWSLISYKRSVMIIICRYKCRGIHLERYEAKGTPKNISQVTHNVRAKIIKSLKAKNKFTN